MPNEDYLAIIHRNAHRLEFWFFVWILLYENIIKIKNCSDIQILK